MTLALSPERYQSDHAQFRQQTHAIEKNCDAALQEYQSHTLRDQDAVNLADRTDSKYVLPVEILPELLQVLKDRHTVLETQNHRIFTYENTYFDTPDWQLYRQHHNGKLNRHKWRFRRYHETDMSYLEFKVKNNKDRTVKTRSALDGDDSTSMTAMQRDAGTMAARLYVNYRRITLWNRAANERLTLDYNLQYQRPGQSTAANLGNIFIAELKRDGKAYGSTFVRRAKEYGYTPTSFSKYCVGVCMTDDGTIKRNRFNRLLKKLNRMHNLGDTAV